MMLIFILAKVQKTSYTGNFFINLEKCLLLLAYFLIILFI